MLSVVLTRHVQLAFASIVTGRQARVNKKHSCCRETTRCFGVISLSHSMSFKIIRNRTIRQIAYEFLLSSFHGNYSPIISEKKRDGRKSRFSYLTCIRRPRYECTRPNTVIRFGTEKTKTVWLSGGEKV